MEINVVENGCRKPGTNFLHVSSVSFKKTLKKFVAVEVFHCTKHCWYLNRKESGEKIQKNKKTVSRER